VGDVSLAEQGHPSYVAKAPPKVKPSVLPMMMKKVNTSTGLKIFMLVGVVGGIVDSIAYQIHVHAHGVILFSVVPRSVLWLYVSTFPGNLLTCLWLLPWGFGFVYLYLGETIADMKLKKQTEEAEHPAGP
jgi:hypothetical protein